MAVRPAPARPAASTGVLAAAFALAAGCAPEPHSTDAAPAVSADAGEPLTATTEVGPVAATVTLRPAAPRLGDALRLSLVVQADAGVVVDMPAFGDALGRFAIVDYAPREEATADGGMRFSQHYTLQSPMSGRQRIPRLRVEFVDERDPDAAADRRARELLTDELGFEVASVLPEGAVGDQLRPARPALPALKGPWLQRHWPWLVGALAAAAALGGGLFAWLRRSEARARETAFDRAAARLDRLRRQGLPDAAGVDAWYVELSDIVRRYIEARFGLRAPERTTEEFLAEAGRSAELSPPHRQLLSAFLERCDRVKFARYSPAAGESEDALAVARRFLEETRAPREAAPTRPPAPPEAVGAV